MSKITSDMPQSMLALSSDLEKKMHDIAAEHVENHVQQNIYLGYLFAGMFVCIQALMLIIVMMMN